MPQTIAAFNTFRRQQLATTRLHVLAHTIRRELDAFLH
jgi:hypothetical protein